MAKQYAVSDDEPATFIAYYGTTLENYRTCAQVTNAGIVLVKTRKSPQGEPETISFVYGLIAGANYAFLRAKKLGHTPIILDGELYHSERKAPGFSHGDESESFSGGLGGGHPLTVAQEHAILSLVLLHQDN